MKIDRRSFRAIGVPAAVAISLALGLGFSQFVGGRPPEHSAMMLPQPKSIAELLQPSEAVVVATVVGVRAVHEIGSYDSTDNQRNETPLDPVSSRIPVTDYELKVESSLGRSPTVKPDDVVLLRMLGRPDGGDEVFPMPRVGDRRLYVLSLNPDAKTYGPHHGAWSILDIGGATIAFADGPRSEVPFARGLTPARFIDLLQAELP